MKDVMLKWGISRLDIARYISEKDGAISDVGVSELVQKIDQLRRTDDEFDSYLKQLDQEALELKDSVKVKLQSKLDFNKEVSCQGTVKAKNTQFVKFPIFSGHAIKIASAACLLMIIGLVSVRDKGGDVLYKGLGNFSVYNQKEKLVLNKDFDVKENDTLVIFSKKRSGYYMILYKDDNQQITPYKHSKGSSVPMPDTSKDTPLMALQMENNFKSEKIWFLYSESSFDMDIALKKVYRTAPLDHIDMDSLELKMR